MRPFLWPWSLAGLITALAFAGAAEAAGPAGFGRCAPTCSQPTCGHAHVGHVPPCAEFAKSNCKPLPPISFSRYVDNGEYDCTRRFYGDACPRCPRFWYAFRQPYPVSHEQGVQAEERQTGIGRGIGY